jgi:hypothetical protein
MGTPNENVAYVDDDDQQHQSIDLRHRHIFGSNDKIDIPIDYDQVNIFFK